MDTGDADDRKGDAEDPAEVIDLDAERHARRPGTDTRGRPSQPDDPPEPTDEALERLASALNIKLKGTRPRPEPDEEE